MPEILRIPSVVKSVDERNRREHIDGIGDAAQYRLVSMGWFITFYNGLVISVGNEKPAFSPDDPVRITVEKVP